MEKRIAEFVLVLWLCLFRAEIHVGLVVHVRQVPSRERPARRRREEERGHVPWVLRGEEHVGPGAGGDPVERRGGRLDRDVYNSISEAVSVRARPYG